MHGRMSSSNSSFAPDASLRQELRDSEEEKLINVYNESSSIVLPVVSSQRNDTDDEEDDNDKQGKRRRRSYGIKWLQCVQSRLLVMSSGMQWIALILLGMLGLLVIGCATVLMLEVVGRMRFCGYFVSQQNDNDQVGFYYEMNVDMQTLKDVTGRQDGKLFPVSALDSKEVKAWVAKRRQRTNGRKFLVGCTSHWKGYVLRSFLALFKELRTEYGWEALDTSKNPMHVINAMDEKQAPSVLLFCLNSFYYPMALLQEYNAFFQELRGLGTITIVWNDDLHYYDQFDPIVLRDEILTKVDVLLGTYTYFMDDYFARVTDLVDERDLPLTVWLPHSSGPDFVNATFNEYPINKIILSGRLGSNWYPLRHWLGNYQQTHQDIMDVYRHSGYYVADNQSAIYASYLRSYRTAITTTLIFQYVIAKLFEIPSTGALLAVNRDVSPLLAAFGMNEGEHYVGFDRQDPEAIIWWVGDIRNWPEIDRIRRAGMELVRTHHLVSNRVKALDLFLMEGEVVYRSPVTLRLTSPCPSKALPDKHVCETRFNRESFYKCDRWFCGMFSMLSLLK